MRRDRLLAITPDDVTAKAERAIVDLDWKGDTRPLHQITDAIRATNAAAVGSIADRWQACALAERGRRGSEQYLERIRRESNYLGGENVRHGG
jgi:hypothetical protein